MVNLIESVLKNPSYARQFNLNGDLITIFNCPLEARLMKDRFADLWSHHNYILYVVEGRKTWHTTSGAYDLRKGNCVFIPKGASIVEQFSDTGFCVIIFFIPDKFIRETLIGNERLLNHQATDFPPVIPLQATGTLTSFFTSMVSYFAKEKDPDHQLLELKFRELILTVADEASNTEMLSYFHSLLSDRHSAMLQRVMNGNYRYNLTIEQYAELCNRSLSAFKRDFKNIMHTTPERWLIEKRLHHARTLLATTEKSIGEIAFASGFTNSSHFTRLFKEKFGASPSFYRKESQPRVYLKL